MRWEGGKIDGCEAFAQLISDAIVPGVRGGLIRGLDAIVFSGLLDEINVCVEAAASAPLDVFGWSGAWELPRQQAVAIASGSVYRIRCLDAARHIQFVAALRRMEREGIGIRRNEGFGWVAVNPSWLLQRPIGMLLGRRDQPEYPAHSWPGVSIKRARLVPLAEEARHAAKHYSKPALKAIAAYAARVHTPEDIAHYLEQMSSRRNARAWKELGGLAVSIRARCNVEEARFFLDALATFAPERTGEES